MSFDPLPSGKTTIFLCPALGNPTANSCVPHRTINLGTAIGSVLCIWSCQMAEFSETYKETPMAAK